MKVVVVSIDSLGVEGVFNVCISIELIECCFEIRISVVDIEGEDLFVTSADISFYKAIKGGLNIEREIFRLVHMKYAGEVLDLPVEIDMEPIGPLLNYQSA